MSLINRMLQDLEKRQAAEPEFGPLRGQVRPLPQHQESHLRWARLAAGFAAAGLLAGGIYIYYWKQGLQPAGNAAAPVPVPQTRVETAQTPQLSAQPQQQQPLPGVAQPESAPPASGPGMPQAALAPSSQTTLVPLPPAAPQLQKPVASPSPVAQESALAARHDASGLKVTTTLGQPGENPERSTAEPPAAKSLSPASSPRSRGEGPPRIEKQMRQATPAERAETEYRRAVSLLNLGRFGEAFASLRAALQADPGHAASRLLLAGMLMEQKRLDEAEEVLREGLAQSPAHPQLAMRMARLQVERGEPGGAADTLQKAAAAAAENAEYRGFYAAVLQRLGRHREAAEEFRSALRLAPQAGVWWMGLGISLEEEHHPAEAREAYQRARASGALSAELEKFVERKLRQLP